jgi:hypothetical protein
MCTIHFVKKKSLMGQPHEKSVKEAYMKPQIWTAGLFKVFVSIFLFNVRILKNLFSLYKQNFCILPPSPPLKTMGTGLRTGGFAHIANFFMPILWGAGQRSTLFTERGHVDRKNARKSLFYCPWGPPQKQFDFGPGRHITIKSTLVFYL